MAAGMALFRALAAACLLGGAAQAFDTAIEGKSQAGATWSQEQAEDFDCVVAVASCDRSWSREKKDWCEQQGAGCGLDREVPHGKRSHLMGVGMAWMLLGSVAFVMALFYLVNWPDKDIRRYSWNIISCTISIFTAVLMFQVIHLLLGWAVPHQYRLARIGADLVVFLAFFLFMNLAIAYVSGANFEGEFVDLGKEVWIVADTMRDDYGEIVPDETVRQPIGRKSIAIMSGVEVFVRKGRRTRERREQTMRCWAVLLAHLTGFAATHLGSHMQHLQIFRYTPFMTLLVVVLSQLMFTALFGATKEVRRRTQSLDGIVDERDELYNEYVEEAEIDAASLSVSFLATQAMRYWLTGVLPNAEGEEEPIMVHPASSIISLYGVGLLLGISAIVLPMTVIPPYATKHDRMRRFVETLQNQGLMTFAWTFFFATRYLCTRSQVLDPLGGPRSMGGRIVTALGFSFVAFFAIFGLDKIEDSAKAGRSDAARTSRAVQSIVNALGILVGFSWEVSFEGAISAVASINPSHSGLVKLLLAPLLCCIIIPAWRQYVLEKVMLYRQMFLDEAEVRALGGGWRTGAYEALEGDDTPLGPS